MSITLWLKRKENSHSPQHTPTSTREEGEVRNLIRNFKCLTNGWHSEDRMRVLTRQPLQPWDLNAEDCNHQIAYRAMPAKMNIIQNLCRIYKEAYQKFSKMCQASVASRISTEFQNSENVQRDKNGFCYQINT